MTMAHLTKAHRNRGQHGAAGSEHYPAVPDPCLSSAGTIQTPDIRVQGHRIIVLSFFDGIGTGLKALQELIGSPLLVISWEIDDECNKVAHHHFPSMQQRGDFMADDPKEVAAIIRRHDEHQCCRILVLSAPPCPDFSV